MPHSNSTLIHKLQLALNQKGQKILYSTSQFYSDKQSRPVTVYHIKKSVWDEEKQKEKSKELFKSTSQIQIVLFLRDYWYYVNDIPIPKDNEKWEEVKREVFANCVQNND